MSLALAGALALAALLRERRPRRPPNLGRVSAGIATTSVVFVGTLFLPWQHVCYPRADVVPGLPRCQTLNAWSSSGLLATVSAGAALVLVVVVAARRLAGAPEAAALLALLVAAQGFGLHPLTSFGLSSHLEYGQVAGFAAAALAVALVASTVRPSRLDRERLPPRLAPLAAVLGYLGLRLAGSTYAFPTSDLRALALGSWLGAAGAALAIALAGAWAPTLGAGVRGGGRLVLLPLAMLALLVVEIAVTWRSGWWPWPVLAAGGLCLLLAWLGSIERARGLENFELPAILRIDRL